MIRKNLDRCDHSDVMFAVGCRQELIHENLFDAHSPEMRECTNKFSHWVRRNVFGGWMNAQCGMRQNNYSFLRRQISSFWCSNTADFGGRGPI